MSLSSDTFEYFEYILDSAEANRGNSGDYTSLNWPLFRFENPVNDVVGLKVIEASIPCSYYVVNTTNNTFVVNNITTPGTFTITVPVGTYTATSLLNTLKTVLDTTTSLTWTVTYDTTTAKYTFSALSGATPQAFNFVFGASVNDGSTNMRLIMGFNAGQTADVVSLTSPNFSSIVGANYLYICSDTIGPHMNLHLPTLDAASKGGLGPEMAMIPINTNFMGLILWQDRSSEYVFYTPGINALQSIDLYLTLGTSFAPMDLNGLSFQIKLGVLKRKTAMNNQFLGVKRMRAI